MDTGHVDHERVPKCRGSRPTLAFPFRDSGKQNPRLFDEKPRFSNPHDAPSRTQPRHSSGVPQNDKFGVAAAAQRRGRDQVDVDDTPMVDVVVAQVDPRPCSAAV
jgi:hypothetical protein